LNTSTNIFANKEKAAIYLFGGCFFVIISIISFDKIVNFDAKPFRSFVILLGVLLFTFGVIYSIVLLFKKAPLLVISEKEIIIWTFLRKEKVIMFKDIESFFLVKTYHRGFVTNKLIFIQLKEPSNKYSNSLFYRIINKITSKKVANSEFSIHTNFLNIKHDELLKLLRNKLRNYNKSLV
jgi:hypothetical protein